MSKRVNILQRFAVKLRQRREDNGALRLDQPKMMFSLDPETKSPSGYRLYEHKHSNKLIEEFMLLANISVAKKIERTFPKLALLRRHPKPKENVKDDTLALLEKYGRLK